MKKYKVAFMSAALSVAAVAVLVQCAPKTKDKEDAKKGPAMATMVEGVDFSALEKAEGTTSTKTLLQSLKDGKAANENTIAMALIEMHVKASQNADGKAADIKAKADTVQEEILKLAEGIKAQKMEELKKSYKVIEDKHKGLRYVPGATSLLNVLDKGEIQEYSGTNLLALLWLKTAGLKTSNAVVLLEEGQLKLAEIRADKKIFSIDSTSKCLVSKDEGTTDELVKAGQKKKLIPLDLFLMHEALKPYVADNKAWALKIQKQANQSLGLKIDEKDLTTSAAEKTKLNLSALLIGEPKFKNINELDSEGCATSATTEVPAAGKKEGEPGVNGSGNNQSSGDNGADPKQQAADKKDVPAQGAGSSVQPASQQGSGETAGEQGASNKAETDSAPGFVSLQEKCLTLKSFKELLPTVNDNKLFSLFAASVRENPKFFTSSKASVLMTRLESEKEHIDLTALAALDLEFTKTAKEALKEAESKKTRLVVVVKPKADQHLAAIWMFDKETGKYVDAYAPTKSGVSINAKAVDYLKSKAKVVEREKDTHLIVEMKTQDGCVK